MEIIGKFFTKREEGGFATLFFDEIFRCLL